MFYFTARGFSEFAYQMAAVAVGWQIYALTDSAFVLGLVGLAQFIPTALLTFIAGHAADRYDRTRVIQVCQSLEALTAAFLAWGSFGGWLTVSQIFAAVTVFGAATAFEGPSVAAILPSVTPAGAIQKGTALSTAAFQIAILSGPAIGGLTYAIAPGVPYTLMALLWAVAGVLNGALKLSRPALPETPPSFSALFAGVGFVRRNPAILGTISLDLFAVLLGGATALLPVYAKDILHTDAWGMGILRSAPAVGALMMTGILVRYPVNRHTGMRMFQAVIAFGTATVLFGISQWLWLSIPALVIVGAADTVSMIIRVSLVQLSTPDEMRGRVGAVNFLFVNASGQLGGFESGIAATLFGAMPAVVIGGVGTILVALLWMRLFPALRKFDRLE